MYDVFVYEVHSISISMQIVLNNWDNNPRGSCRKAWTKHEIAHAVHIAYMKPSMMLMLMMM